MDLIALSIPVFFALMAVEWGISVVQKRSVYRFSDWIANLGCGIVQQIIQVVLTLFVGLAYIYLYEEYRFLELDTRDGWVWLLCFVGVDFFYYWFHRMSHELNFMWAAHVVHHQSEEYNLGVALRQSAFQEAFSWAFYLPLAIIGFPPLMVGVLRAINSLYQFWIHTQLIDRMGPFEWLFNTPSHHRVHHGQNPQYVDRNHGGTLIVWDKLFGTFEPEDEPVIYGVTEPPLSWDPIFANFHHVGLTAQRMMGARHWRDKIKVWLTHPGYVPAGVDDHAKRLDMTKKYDQPLAPALLYYVGAHFILLAFGVVSFLFYREALPLSLQTIWGGAVILTAGVLGALLDGKLWALRFEWGRVVIFVVTAYALVPLDSAVQFGLVGVVLVSGVAYRAARSAQIQLLSQGQTSTVPTNE